MPPRRKRRREPHEAARDRLIFKAFRADASTCFTASSALLPMNAGLAFRRGETVQKLTERGPSLVRPTVGCTFVTSRTEEPDQPETGDRFPAEVSAKVGGSSPAFQGPCDQAAQTDDERGILLRTASPKLERIDRECASTDAHDCRLRRLRSTHRARDHEPTGTWVRNSFRTERGTTVLRSRNHDPRCVVGRIARR